MVAPPSQTEKTAREWITQYTQNASKALKELPLSAFDDKSDNEALKIGFRLYNKFGLAVHSLTAQDIIDEIYRSHENNSGITVEKCTSL